MQKTGKNANIVAAFFMVTGSVVAEPTVAKIPIEQIVMKLIIVPTVVIALIM